MTDKNEGLVPQDVSDVLLAFPATVCGTLLPERDSLPDLYRKNWHLTSNHWCQIAEQWFYQGLTDAEWKTKEGIDLNKALRHLQACLGSFEPKHEHKIGGVGYLMSLWFEDVKLPEKSE